MKKKLLITLFLLISITFGYQFFIEKEDIKKVQENYAKMQKEHPFSKTLQLTKKERKAQGIPPNKYYEEKYLLEMNPHTGRTHPENLEALKEELKAMRSSRAPGDGIDCDWEERGPNNVGGRTRVVLFDPNDATHKRVFAGGVSGGLWVNNDITDANSSWTQVGIDENLAISCMAVDPNNSQIMYIGTGELYTGDDALGNGVWRSMDGGATWTNVYRVRGATTTGGNYLVSGTYYTTDIVVRDADGNSATTNDSEVFVSVGGRYYTGSPVSTFIGLSDYGLFKSADTGTNWNRVTFDNVSGRPEAPNNLEIGSDNTLWISTTRNIYGDSGGSVYSSTNGNTFTLKHTVSNARRTEIAVSKTDADKIYILAQLTTDPVGLYLTTDAFATTPTTLALPDDVDTGIPANDFTRGQAFYDLMLAVDPNNDAIAYVGGIDLFRTADSGTSWTQISKWSNNNDLAALNVPLVHADQHGWAFHPTNSDIAVNGNDGGVYYASSLSGASSSTTAISARNKDYNVTQFYKGSIGQGTSPELLLAGAQDNGTQFVNGASSGVNGTIEVFGGDGGFCFIDKDESYMIVSYVYNNILRLNLPYNGTGIYINQSNSGDFINPMELDDNLDILYTKWSSTQLARYSGITGTVAGATFSHALLSNISTIKVSPYTMASSTIFVGTSDGTLAKVENVNASPTITNISGGSFLGSVSAIEFGANEDEILVTFHNFGVDSVWYTTDGGTSWANKEGDLPDIPVKAILMNPLNNDEVILGTEFGVWSTGNFKDASPSWTQSYNGMSGVPVTSFDFRTSDNTILASTYGRGMFTGKFTSRVVWTGTDSRDWATAGNWDTGAVPTTTNDVIIPGGLTNYPTAASAVDVKSIKLASGSTFIAQSTVAGDVTYKRTLSATDKWYLVAAPVVGETIDNLIDNHTFATGSSTNIGLAPYDNTQTDVNDRWDYQELNSSGAINNGQGYSVRLATPGDISFKGTLNTNDVTQAITIGAGDAFNLIGNPYPSYINSGTFLTTNTGQLDTETIWVWNQATDIYDTKVTVNAFKVAPGQGFFVECGTAGTITFAKANQSHEATDTFQRQTVPEIKLVVADETTSRYAEIYYYESATTGFDNGYDGELFGGTQNSFEIYSHLLADNQGNKYQIQSLPNTDLESMVIPIGVKADAGKEITFSVEAMNLPTDVNIYLEDKEA
ncbi:MAG: hypothetical protein ACPGTO_03845, partial [Polaribacter sp.]